MVKWICVARLVLSTDAPDSMSAVKDVKEEIDYLQESGMLASQLKRNIECFPSR